MAHRTLVGGVTYATKGGKDLIGGTLYKKKKGRVLVDGTVYEIGLGSNAPIVLEVEKITSSTYAAETEYTDEQFILLDIYPKKNGTVTVTYGGLTKTITDTSGAENPNAQKVFFGTFNGVSDSVATPTSGTLIIEGDCYSFGVASYQKSSKTLSSSYCTCITAVNEWGNITKIAGSAFMDCTSLTSVPLPDTVVSIESGAFSGCSSLALTSLPSGVTSIENYTFSSCTSLALTSLPSGVTSIGMCAFENCSSLAITSLPSGVTEIKSNAFAFGEISIDVVKNRQITLPSTLQTMGENLFTYRFNNGTAMNPSWLNVIYLEKLILLAPTPPVFDTTNALPLGTTISGQQTQIVVPKGCGEAYKAATGWVKYQDMIVEVS